MCGMDCKSKNALIIKEFYAECFLSRSFLKSMNDNNRYSCLTILLTNIHYKFNVLFIYNDSGYRKRKEVIHCWASTAQTVAGR